MFKDKTGKSHSLKTALKAPVMFDGEVMQIGNDLLGKTICDSDIVFISDPFDFIECKFVV
ncbi:MAG: hypothetical protein ACUZ8O_07155 [Candidatus Anammoxibacter sp.]